MVFRSIRGGGIGLSGVRSDTGSATLWYTSIVLEVDYNQYF